MCFRDAINNNLLTGIFADDTKVTTVSLFEKDWFRKTKFQIMGQ